MGMQIPCIESLLSDDFNIKEWMDRRLKVLLEALDDIIAEDEDKLNEKKRKKNGGK